MTSNSEEQPDVQPRLPIYHRWRDERSPLVVELKVELVPRIYADLQAAEDLGLEGGGILIGSFPKSIGAPALRIDEFESIGRRGGDGSAYVLLAEQRQRFTAVRKRVATREVSAVGFFRSHLRSGPFELTLADRDLLAAEFKNTIHVALLIGKDQSSVSGSPDKAPGPRLLATYFVSINGIIQNRVDPQTFPFDLAELEKAGQSHAKLYVDVPPMPSAARTEEGVAGRLVQAEAPIVSPAALAATGIRRAAWIGVGAIAVLSLLFTGWGWQRQSSPLMAGILPGPAPGLSVTVSRVAGLPNRRQALEIDWNHQSVAVLEATKAYLTITNTSTHQVIQELDLQPVDLAQGTLRVEMDEQPTQVLLIVFGGDGKQVVAVGQPAS